MSWLGQEWSYRLPLSLLNTQGGNNLDASFSIPADFGPFWRNSLSSLNDVRVTAADGRTLLNWKQGSNTNYSNKLVEVEVDGYDFSGNTWGTNAGAAVANRAVKAYMYWGNDTANLASGQAGSVSISNAITPTIQMARPGGSNSPRIVCGRQRKGQIYPDATIIKQTTDTKTVWWDLRSCMQYRSRHNERSVLLEEIAWANIAIENVNGVDFGSSMLDLGTVAFSNHHLVSHTLKGGANENQYLLTLTVGTDDGMGGTRILDYRANVRVLDLIVNP